MSSKRRPRSLDEAAIDFESNAAAATRSFSQRWSEGMAFAHGVTTDDVQRALSPTELEKSYLEGLKNKGEAWKAGMRRAYRSSKE